MFNPKYVTIGKDVKKIYFYDNFILKYFKNRIFYDKTIDFYNKYNFNFIPKLIKKDNAKIMIKQEYVGNMISLKNNLPITWESQINNI